MAVYSKMTVSSYSCQNDHYFVAKVTSQLKSFKERKLLFVL